MEWVVWNHMWDDHFNYSNCKESGEQDWRSGESTHLPPLWPGFDSQTQHLSGLSLLILLSAPRGFSPGIPIFPSPQKQTFDLICFVI